MEKIIYVGYYNSNKNNQKRNITLSAVNKMNYIIEILDKRFEVNVLSVSESIEKKNYPLTIEKLFDNSKLILLPSRKTGNVFRRVLQRMLLKYELIKYILKRTDQNTKVIVYHSLGYLNIIKLLKKIKKFRLILEVEEIYADVINNDKIRKQEINFFKSADSYIFSTHLLNKKINKENIPYVIIHGTYKIEKQRSKKFRDKDGKIHIIYSGTLDPRKGVINTIDTAFFLDERYHIHVIGFGSEGDILKMKKRIELIADKTKCKVTYDGLKSGEEYIRFLQSCDIGMCTQKLDASFNNTSFPSKLLSYMTNGLRVVSIKIPAIEKSDIANYLYYYEEDRPEQIAKVIKTINIFSNYNSRNIILNLNLNLKKELLKIF